MKEMKKDSEQMQSHESVMESETIQKNGASLKSRTSRRNMKLFTLLIFIMLFGFRAMAQDVIVLKSGDEIKSLVQEIGTEYVKYKKFDNQTGPVYNVAISEIFMIKYADGSKDVFNEPVKETKAEQSVQPTKEEVKHEVQKQDESANLSVVGRKIFLNGKAIKHEQVKEILTSNDLLTNAGASDLYNSGHSLRQVAILPACVGFASGVYAFVLLFKGRPTGDPSAAASYDTTTWTCCGVGAGFCIFGCVLMYVGDNKMKEAINIYNNSIHSKHSSDVSLNFGVTRSGGLGFTLDF